VIRPRHVSAVSFKEKSFIRKEVLGRRDALSRELREAKDESIRQKLLALPEFAKAGTVLFYASFRSEVDTMQLLNHSLLNGKNTVLPKVDTSNSTLLLYTVRSLDELASGHFGVPEPRGDRERLVGPGDVDLIIVPGVAFDEFCNRLGYGKGYYDKLLSQKNCPAVALAYEEQLVQHLPSEAHDIKMDKIITDKRIIQQGRS
jgi:5-formyltetrahydrofolate cyclo-ligase